MNSPVSTSSVFKFLLLSAVMVCLVGCLDSQTASERTLDAAVTSLDDAGRSADLSYPDQQLFETRSLEIRCETLQTTACTPQRFETTIRTDSVFQLNVRLSQMGRPESATLVNFAFTDVMGNDLETLRIEDTELQVRSVATDSRGFASVVLTTGVIETDLKIRAFIPGVGQVEWFIEVRRERVGVLEIDTEYQPGSQNRGASQFDTVRVFLLPDTFSDESCTYFASDPSTLDIHAVQEETGIFTVSSERFESLVTFDSVDSEFLYVAVAIVVNSAGELIGYGCQTGLGVEPEQTQQYAMTIEDVVIPLDYKGNYRVRLKWDMSSIFDLNVAELQGDDVRRLQRLMLFQQFRDHLYRFSSGLDNRAQMLKELFCEYVVYTDEQCSQTESYIVRGLLGPLVDEVIVPEAPQFLTLTKIIADSLSLIRFLEIEGTMNVGYQNPDSFGFLKDNEFRWNVIRFFWGEGCILPYPTVDQTLSDGCQSRAFRTNEVHLQSDDQFMPISALFDAETNGSSLTILYHELEVHFGLILTRLLEKWIFPLELGTDEASRLLDILQFALPCSPVDQFVGDDFCLPFLLTNFEYLVRQLLVRFDFGGFQLGITGTADIVDLETDRVVDEYRNGRFVLYLPEALDEEEAERLGGEDEPTAEQARERLGRRLTRDIKACFSACRCVLDPCVCEPVECSP